MEIISRATEVTREVQRPEVVMITMPFGPILSPSIGVSLLKAALARIDITSTIQYFGLRFAELTGERFYTRLANARRPALRELAGEWIFSAALFPAKEGSEAQYVDEILRLRAAWGEGAWTQRPIPKRTIDAILRARSNARQFIEECAAEVVAASPRVVGFTSAFQQHVASLALARRIRELAPQITIVFGGANCEGPMGAETIRSFEFVDAVVSGEGDLVVPILFRRILDSLPFDDIEGVYTKANIGAIFANGTFPNAQTVIQLDALPHPDYSDFREQFADSRFATTWEPTIFFESSRGCWWGAKSHCTFCGLNGTTMEFRSKSSDRAMTELLALAGDHPGWDVQVTDNILDLRYFNDFIPQLAERGIDLSLFYETKSNLRKDQLRMLRAANIRGIQPGIESLSDEILSLMRKGVTALQNIQLLKWCKELGVDAAWNVLWGFPGERESEYARMAQLVPDLEHLPPPGSFSGIRMDRFSPNYFDAHRLGFGDVSPLPSYRHIYDLPDEAVANLAYYFTFSYHSGQNPRGYVGPFLIALRRWQNRHEQCDLFSVDRGDEILVWDLRHSSRRPLTRLRDTAASLYRSCDAATGTRDLERSHPSAPQALEQLVEDGLMIRDDSRYLSLAVPLGDYIPSEGIAERFYEVASSVSRSDRSITVRRTQPRRASRTTRDQPPVLSPSHFVSREHQIVIH